MALPAGKLIDRWLSNANDWHMPSAGMIFIVGTILQWFNHLSGDYVAFSGTVLGFIGGHAWVKMKGGGDDSASGSPAPPGDAHDSASPNAIASPDTSSAPSSREDDNA